MPIKGTIRKCSGERIQATHKVDNLEKRFLVWTGKYKNVGEVPEYVGQNVMERCRNKVRIKIANYMMAATALGCIFMIVLGKRAAAKGESLSEIGENYHKELKNKESST